MQIRVKYLAQLKQAAGVGEEWIEAAGPCAPATIVQQLAQRHGDAFRRLLLDPQGRLHRAILLFAGDEQVRPDEPFAFQEHQALTILVPMAGG